MREECRLGLCSRLHHQLRGARPNSAASRDKARGPLSVPRVKAGSRQRFASPPLVSSLIIAELQLAAVVSWCKHLPPPSGTVRRRCSRPRLPACTAVPQPLTDRHLPAPGGRIRRSLLALGKGEGVRVCGESVERSWLCRKLHQEQR